MSLSYKRRKKLVKRIKKEHNATSITLIPYDVLKERLHKKLRELFPSQYIQKPMGTLEDMINLK